MRIAILKPSALGDVVHALPVLSALRDRFPDAHIAWVVNRGYAPLLHGHPYLSEIIPFDRGAFKKPWTAVPYAAKFATLLRKKRFDVVLDLQGLLRTGLMAAATGAARKLGFANAREGAPRFYTDRIEVPDAESIHAVDRYWKFAEFLDAGGGPKRFVLPVSQTETAAALAMLQHLPRPWVMAVVGSRWVTKCWPPGHYAALLNRGAGSVVFVGAKEDVPLAVQVAASLKLPHLDLCGATTLPRLAAVLKLADAVVGNDTGPVHLAAALARPCVVPYTCTSPVKHGPYGVGGGVPTAVGCRASYLKRCPNGLICFDELTPDRLWPAFREVLRPWLSTSPSA